MIRQSHLRLAPSGVAAVLTAVLIAGCAGSGPVGPQHVGLSLLAPTDGATVNVRSITVLGHVIPQVARVSIAGRHVKVRKGTFRLRLMLPRRVNHIGIIATAPGYIDAALQTTVRYKGRRGAPPGAGYADRAEAICVGFDDRMGRLGLVTMASDPSTIGSRLTALTDLVQRLSAVVVPRSVGSRYHRLLARLQSYVDGAHSLLADRASGDLTGAEALIQRLDGSEPGLYNQASKLNIPDCGGMLDTRAH